jgi:hypothetical protein
MRQHHSGLNTLHTLIFLVYKTTTDQLTNNQTLQRLPFFVCFHNSTTAMLALNMQAPRICQAQAR